MLFNLKNVSIIVLTFKIVLDLIRAIDETGSISKMSKEVHKELINSPLKCHKCNFVPKTMPNLKEHLLSHIK